MITMTTTEAAEEMVGWVEPKPTGPPTGSKESPGGYWIYTYYYDGTVQTAKEWMPRIALDSLDDCVRCIEAKGLEWSFDTDAVGYHYAGIRGDQICYGDNNHALHLAEAALSAVKGEQVEIQTKQESTK